MREKDAPKLDTVQARSVRDATEGLMDAKAALIEIQAAGKEYGVGDWLIHKFAWKKSDAYRILRSKRGTIMNVMRVVADFGKPQAHEIKILGKELAEPDTLEGVFNLVGDAEEAVRTLEGKVDRVMKANQFVREVKDDEMAGMIED